MIETITAVNDAVNHFIWGIPAMISIIGVGLLLSVRTRFLQIRKFPYAIKTTIGRMFRKKDATDGAMTPFQAVCTALAAASEVTYGLVSFMELAAHRGDLHRHHLLRRHLCRVLYRQAPAAHQGCSGCGARRCWACAPSFRK